MVLDFKKPVDKPKICLVGFTNSYPAFNSVSSILKEILESKNVIELRINDWLKSSPSMFKFPLYLLRDFSLFLKVLSYRKDYGIRGVLLFQNYYPLTCIGVKILNLKLILYVGGSGFFWSNLENTSMIVRIFVYANLPIENICHKLADIIITLSRSMVQIIRTEKHMNKMRFALPRLDEKFFKEFKIFKKFESRKNVIGFLGSLVKRKGLLEFIEAIRIMEKEKMDYQFFIVGDGPLLETVETKVKNYGLENKVKLTGFVDYNDLVKYFNEMKLLVLPSYAEGIPSTIFEAMACGTPVLATPVGGIPDIVKDGETGFLLKSNDPEYISKKIHALLENPEILNSLSAQASTYVKNHFSEARVIESWRRIFQ